MAQGTDLVGTYSLNKKKKEIRLEKAIWSAGNLLYTLCGSWIQAIENLIQAEVHYVLLIQDIKSVKQAQDKSV